MGCILPLHMMILMDIICMCLLLLLAIIMREEPTSPPLYVSNANKIARNYLHYVLAFTMCA